MKLSDEIRGKIVSEDSINRFLEKDFRADKKIVFTNGCFDILHPGHVHLLISARQLGDLLIVGLNSDASVKRLKGNERPVMDEQSRAVVLAAIKYVDLIVLFSEETPLELIKKICPDVLVKGGDYNPDDIVGAEFVKSNGGKTITIPFLEGFSSTRLIQKTKKL
jgi:D-beta-D-heptose 7-phosphate kinase/D-beta-D-heptose 1-phosphate adenosyltransferase